MPDGTGTLPVMNRMLALLVATVVLLAACNGDDTTEPTTAPTTTAAPAVTEATTPPTTAGAETTTTASPTTTTTTTTTTTEPPGPLTIEITVADGVVTGPGRAEVAIGRRVNILVTADVDDEVHLHGYDVKADVGPSKAALIEFDADIPGIFEVELEDAGLLLAELEVS
jgi:cytoskeletal protein RodZ